MILAGEKWKAGPAGATVVGTGEWRRLLAGAPAPPAVATDPDAPAGIGFTGGTTGAPKGIVHSQRNLPAGQPGELRLAPAVAGKWAGAWTAALGEWRDGGVVPLAAPPFPTGDIGTVSADGWLAVTDRKKLIMASIW